MKNNILAICDSEQEYAYRLTDALSQNGDFPFEVLTFTSADRLCESLAERPAALLLVAQHLYAAREWPAARILLLWEEKNPPENGLEGIGKYSGIGKIRRKIMEAALEGGTVSPCLKTDAKTRFWGLYTPVGRCLQTTFAFTLGQLLARTHKVLYISFECFSGLSSLLGRSFEADFSRLLYFLEEPEEVLLSRIYGMVENVNGMDILPPALSGFDILQISPQEWAGLWAVLEKSRYEYVLLDLSENVQGLFEILDRCSRIFTITREDSFAQAKLSEYERLLKRADQEAVLGRTRKVKFPVFSKLPRDLNHQTMGELAEFTERMLEDGAD